MFKLLQINQRRISNRSCDYRLMISKLYCFQRPVASEMILFLRLGNSCSIFKSNYLASLESAGSIPLKDFMFVLWNCLVIEKSEDNMISRTLSSVIRLVRVFQQSPQNPPGFIDSSFKVPTTTQLALWCRQ